MLVRVFTRKHRSGSSVPVYLNVYDVTPINGYAYWLGLGAYHSGIHVHGVEYAYGAHDHPTTGIFEVEPRQCPGFRFRKEILLGETNLSPREVRLLMDDLAGLFSGNTYHLITKNCNHFCNEASLRLTSNPIPRWVNRLANLGFFCNCVLPTGLHVAAPRQKAAAEEGEKVKLKLIGGGEERKGMEVENKKLRTSKSSRSANASTSSSSSLSSSASFSSALSRSSSDCKNNNKTGVATTAATASVPVWRRMRLPSSPRAAVAVNA